MLTKLFYSIIFFFVSFVLLSQNEKKKIAASKTTSTITIDGELLENDWQNADVASNFIMFDPDNGKPIPDEFKTEVKVLYNDDAVYIGAVMYDNEPSKIMREITERDDFGSSDFFGIFINGFNDGQQDFRFLINAANGQADCVATDQSGEDYSWNAIWLSKVKITDFGWVVEVKIPYAALRFSNENKQIWGINFMREIRRKRQKFTWNYINTQLGTIIQQAGVLSGIENIKTPTRLFLIPYASGYAYASSTQKTATEFKGGLDVKYGINDAFTLDAILIPDFGQTKFDNVVLNLGPFEQQFNENRPFFTEGIELFSKGNLLYSRRIGAVPNLAINLEENETISEMPSTINLLNALKISGRDKNGLGVGFLNAITEKTTTTAYNSVANTKREVVVSPLTNYNVTVLDQRFNQNSSVSLINTNVTRNGSFRDANVLGILFDLNNKKNSFNFSGDMKMSSVYDATNTSGYNTSLFLGKTSGKIRFSSGVNYISEDFDNNDLGINFQTNFTSWYSNANYRILNPTKWFNTFRVNLNSYFEYNNTTGRIQSSEFNVNVNSTNKKNHFFGGGLNYNPFLQYDYYEPRQNGRYVILPEYFYGWLYFSSNYNYKFAIDVNPYTTITSENGRYSYGITIGPRYRFSNRLNVIVNFDIFKQFDNVGFIDSDAATIYFAKRNRDTYTSSVSSKYSINSNMNFNLTVRHYWSYAENNSFFALEDNGTLTATNYTGNKNSNFSTWNLDLSYSWWFAPGSQISVLYRNNANTFSREINRDFGKNFNTLLTDNLNHVFSISVRYYIDYNQAKNWFKKN
ncbi:DUF5916 domain-containing protein [Flavobacterium sp.]|uniref:DUF5916 domain-containing protein n=1 Tax=Flavobacterium sp. TaxID=239 RepID=UPI003529BEDC